METTTDYATATGLFVSLAGIEANDAYSDGEINVYRVATRVQGAAEALARRTVIVTDDLSYASMLERGNGYADMTADVADVIMACVEDEDFWDFPEPDEDEPDEDEPVMTTYYDVVERGRGDSWHSVMGRFTDRGECVAAIEFLNGDSLTAYGELAVRKTVATIEAP